MNKFFQNKIYNQTRKGRNGFTLLEMIVSVSVFTIVMFMTIGSLLVVNDTLRKTKLLRSSIDNVNIAMEGMVKKIRTGSVYHCGSSGDNRLPADCTTATAGGESLAFQTADGRLFRYRLSGERLEVCEKLPGEFVSSPSPPNPCVNADEFISITSPEIKIEGITFWVNGSSSATQQANVTISIKGLADIPGKDRFDTAFNVQTTVSKRVLDIFN